MTATKHIYEIRPRKDKRGVDLISEALPFGALWYTLSLIFQHATFTNPQLFEFYAGTADTEFLFEADVLKHLEQTRYAYGPNDFRAITSR